MLDIWQSLQNCWTNKERAVLATIIEVDGAAYRREGTRCLILESGTIIGALSGGCVEGDLLEYAREVLDTGTPRQVFYDFRSEGDLYWGLGLGCNGAITLWLQPFDLIRHPTQAGQLIQEFQKRASCLEAYTAAMVLESTVPSRITVGSYLELDQHEGELPTGIMFETVHGVLVKLFVETVKARPRLIVFGAGSGAVPLVQAAKNVHWHVAIVDHREDFLNHASVKADERFLIARSQYSEISVSDETYVVIMTHNYELDRMLVETFLHRSIPYLGVLGSRNRIERILEDIRRESGELSEQTLEKLHSPIGLDIGAESPEEIALSIASELVSRKNRRNGESLRLRKEPMHKRQNTCGFTKITRKFLGKEVLANETK
jgi:xanthine dehydrogenase accessory factor